MVSVTKKCSGCGSPIPKNVKHVEIRITSWAGRRVEVFHKRCAKTYINATGMGSLTETIH